MPPCSLTERVDEDHDDSVAFIVLVCGGITVDAGEREGSREPLNVLSGARFPKRRPGQLTSSRPGDSVSRRQMSRTVRDGEIRVRVR